MTVLDRALVAGDAGRVTGERQGRPDPQVPERACRRTFTAAVQAGGLADYDAAEDGEGRDAAPGGPVLQPHHGVAASPGAGALAGLGAPRGRPAADPRDAQIARLRRRRPGWSGAGQGPIRGGCPGKTTGALGDDLRERGHRDRADAVTDEAITHGAADRNPAACAAAGRAAGQLVPAAPDHPAAPPRRRRCRTGPAPAAGADRGGAGRRSWMCCTRAVRRPGPGRGLGDPAGRGRLPGVASRRSTGCCAPPARPANAAGRPPTRRRSNPSWSRPARTRCGPGTSPSCTARRNGPTTTCT